MLDRLGEARKARSQIEALMAGYPDDAWLQANGKAAVEAMTAWDHRLNQPLHQTYEDEDAWETMLAGQLRYLLNVIDSTGAPVTDGAMQRLGDLKTEWSQRRTELRAITANQIEPINAWARDHEVAYVAAPEIQ